jgi:hypothetical protein
MKASTEGPGDRTHRRSKNGHGRPHSSWIDIAVLALLTWPACVAGSGSDHQGDPLSTRWWSRGESRESSRARRLRPTSALTSSLRATNTTSSSTSSNVTGGLVGDIRIVRDRNNKRTNGAAIYTCSLQPLTYGRLPCCISAGWRYCSAGCDHVSHVCLYGGHSAVWCHFYPSRHSVNCGSYVTTSFSVTTAL